MFYAYGHEKGSKLTRLEVWKRIKKRSGKDAGKPEPKDPELLYLWNDFIEMIKGFESIGYTEIDTYQRLMDIKFTDWEIRLLVDIEAVRSGRHS